MATDRELSDILNSGEISTIYLGGTASTDRAVKQSALDATNANVTTNTTNVATNTTDIAAIDTRVTSIEDSHTRLLLASSTASSQQPTGTDTPLQVEFGVAQSTTDIDISAAGAITFKTAGKYIISPFFQYGRTGATGTSVLLNRYLVNGTQIGASLGANLDNANTLVPWSSSVQFTANTNDVMTIEIMRDSAGNDSGGLFAVTPTAAGWNSAPCASIQIYRAI